MATPSKQLKANGAVETGGKRRLSKSPSRSKGTISKTESWTTYAFSSNPDKAWAEKFFLAYSLVWPLLFGGWASSGIHLLVGDLGNLIVTLLIASPNVVYPYLYAPALNDGRAFYERFWFKFLLWIFIFAFVATYFFTEYFFDVLGMKYAFPHLKWNFDSILVGRGQQRVPFMMLFHGWYFFVTYHTCSIIFIRLVRHRINISLPFLTPSLRSGLATTIAALFFAWGEIKFTTMDSIKDQFEYGDMNWALSWGASIYACYFIASFPMVKNLDETTDEIWTLSKTIENALAASMIAFIVLDLFCMYVVPDTWLGRDWFPSLPKSN